MNDYELVIIGGGPTGLFATFLAGLRDIKSITLEALDYTGGQIPELYPEKTVYDVQGIPRINAMELRDRMYEQAKTFNSEIALNSKVSDIIQSDNRFTIEVNGEQKYTCKAVLICTGIGDFEPRKLGCAGEDQFYHKGVDYTVKDIKRFSNKTVAVIGGGDAALDYANELSSYAKKIYVIHHSEKFKAAEKTLKDALSNSKIEVVMNTSVTKMSGDNYIKSITLHNEIDKTEKNMDIDEVIIAIGHIGKANVFKSVKLETNATGRNILVSQGYETNIKGIYAVGDIATIEGESIHPLIAVDGGDAYNAINYIKKFLTPNASIFGGHSSNLNI